MFRQIFFFSCLLLVCMLVRAQENSHGKTAVIFDSDMGPDYDDVGAITLLHAFADKGKADILATMASTKYEGVAAVFNVFNTYFKRPGIPIGVPKGNAVDEKDWQHWTDTLLKKYPHRIKTNSEVPDAVKLYRKILSSQPNHSVTIVTVGFLTNLANLLNTSADEYSSFSGRELVSRKVKQLVSMAGRFPGGREFNVFKDAAASKIVFENWPTPVLFSGFEIGMKIFSGLPLAQNKSIHNDPVKDVFSICIPMSKEDSAGRKSWDETAVLVAIEGYKNWYQVNEGKIEIAEDGSNKWDDKKKRQFHLVEKRPVEEVQELINKLMMHQPR
jgi:pyrimidine-specific ribonucleoside hydrolase